MIFSVVATFYVCPRLVSIESDIAVFAGIAILILMIPFLVWQFYKFIKALGEKIDA
jgi:Ca2+/Na+ antiporter